MIKPFRLSEMTQEILEAEQEPLQKFDQELFEEDSDTELDMAISKNNSDSKTDLGILRLENPAKLCDTYPKVQYSMDVNRLFHTPINNRVLRNSSSVSQSFPKFATIAERNCLVDNIDAAKQCLPNRYLNANFNKARVSLNTFNLTDETFTEITVKNVKYIILRELGKGGSSVVYHCFEPRTRCERAIKKVNLASDSYALGYINEVKVLELLQKCDRIIKMYDYEIGESSKVMYVVLEKGGHDLSHILKDLANKRKYLPMYMLMFYWMEMLHAVKQIHDNGIIHSDLKPANFLKTDSGLKLIDFGIASCLNEDMTSVVKNTQVGSFNYISPEALIQNEPSSCDSPDFKKPRYKINYKSDVWSLGCILYQLVYRKTPFQQYTHILAKLNVIIDPGHQINYPNVDRVPENIINTIKRCLQFDVKSRPSVEELIKEYENMYEFGL